MYKILFSELHSTAPNVTSRFWPPLIFQEILEEDIITLSALGFSHGLLGARYMAKKPLYGEVYLMYQDKAGLLRSMAHHLGLVVGILISTFFIIRYS